MEWFEFVNKSQNKEWIDVAYSEVLWKGGRDKELPWMANDLREGSGWKVAKSIRGFVQNLPRHVPGGPTGQWCSFFRSVEIRGGSSRLRAAGNRVDHELQGGGVESRAWRQKKREIRWNTLMIPDTERVLSISVQVKALLNKWVLPNKANRMWGSARPGWGRNVNNIKLHWQCQQSAVCSTGQCISEKQRGMKEVEGILVEMASDQERFS